MTTSESAIQRTLSNAVHTQLDTPLATCRSDVDQHCKNITRSNQHSPETTRAKPHLFYGMHVSRLFAPISFVDRAKDLALALARRVLPSFSQGCYAA
jgi:hypothetical protein